MQFQHINTIYLIYNIYYAETHLPLIRSSGLFCFSSCCRFSAASFWLRLNCCCSNIFIRSIFSLAAFLNTWNESVAVFGLLVGIACDVDVFCGGVDASDDHELAFFKFWSFASLNGCTNAFLSGGVIFLSIGFISKSSIGFGVSRNFSSFLGCCGTFGGGWFASAILRFDKLLGRPKSNIDWRPPETGTWLMLSNIPLPGNSPFISMLKPLLWPLMCASCIFIASRLNCNRFWARIEFVSCFCCMSGDISGIRSMWCILTSSLFMLSSEASDCSSGST